MKRSVLCMLALFFAGGAISFANASDEVVLKDYPFQPIPFTKVHFSDGFWLPRMETNRTTTIPFAFRKCEETGRIENFKVAGKLSEKSWQGHHGFDDTDIYKITEGASYALMVKPDPELEAYLDELLTYVAAAQEEDGYLYTPLTADSKKSAPNVRSAHIKTRWDNLPLSHELYNVGHMYEGAVAHYLATGKRTFLDIALKNADLICRTFGPDGNPGVPGHQEIEIGLVKLYRATGERKYLDQARWFLLQRGKSTKGGREYDQSHKPVIEQTEAVGHAVRATYMYTAMADVAALTDDPAFLRAIDAIWEDVTDRKLYLTGGLGARHSGESYGDAYELPNQSAYCETCAVIAGVYWNHRMFLLHGDAKYINVMERMLYNNLLSGVALDGMKFFYPNPLESEKGHERSPWFGCACCPGNICRFMASVPGYVYAVREGEVYVNLFVDSQAEFEVDGSMLTIRQQTTYPLDGTVVITPEPEQEQEFVLKIRLPDWIRPQAADSKLYTFSEPISGACKVTVNGKDAETDEEKGYLCIRRRWKKGDSVKIDFPMTVRRVLCDDRVQDNVGKAAIQRGPLVYCLEQHDVEGGQPLNLILDLKSDLTSEYCPELLGGLTVIRGVAMEQETERPFKMIPYYAWAHRGKQPMVVWIPYTKK